MVPQIAYLAIVEAPYIIQDIVPALPWAHEDNVPVCISSLSLN